MRAKFKGLCICIAIICVLLYIVFFAYQISIGALVVHVVLPMSLMLYLMQDMGNKASNYIKAVVFFIFCFGLLILSYVFEVMHDILQNISEHILLAVVVVNTGFFVYYLQDIFLQTTFRAQQRLSGKVHVDQPIDSSIDSVDDDR